MLTSTFQQPFILTDSPGDPWGPVGPTSPFDPCIDIFIMQCFDVYKFHSHPAIHVRVHIEWF